MKKPKSTPVSGTFKDAYRVDVTLPCPFCGGQPILVPWHGGPKTRRNLMCRNDECIVQPSICMSSERRAVYAWNGRARTRLEQMVRNIVFNVEPSPRNHSAEELVRGLGLKAGERP